MRYATRSAILPYTIPEISSVSSSIVSHIKSADCGVYDLTIATVLHSVVCSHCAACGLSQQVATLPELSALCYTLGYLTSDSHQLPLERVKMQARDRSVAFVRTLIGELLEGHNAFSTSAHNIATDQRLAAAGRWLFG